LCEGDVYEFVDVPTYDITADSESEAEGFDTYDVDCPHCHEKYTIEFTAHAFGVTAEIPSYPNINVDVTVPPEDTRDYEAEYEEYLRNYVSNDPHGIYKTAVGNAKRLMMFASGTPVENKTFYRLLYVQYFSIVEAYLSDHLTKALFADNVALVKLVEKHRDWSKEKISLATMLKDSEAANSTIKERLQAVMYHNFLAVDFNYRTAFGYSIFPDTTTKDELIRMAYVRHDCVHRNGRDKENNERDIGLSEVEELAAAIDRLVTNIESNNPFF